MVTLQNRLEEAVIDKDEVSIRSHLTSFIDKYPLNRENAAIKAFEFARSSYPGFIDEHDGSTFTSDEATWNLDYFAILMDDLIDNFSEQRFFHTIEVSAVIFGRNRRESRDTEKIPVLPSVIEDISIETDVCNDFQDEFMDDEPEAYPFYKMLYIIFAAIIVIGAVIACIQFLF
ncbi:MAG: hypothetical protein K8S56_05495 [Candidatus Cloacimonetes bacterium]|nr:hypothetical protein [Candidatus Cloacimonadota bacterium]